MILADTSIWIDHFRSGNKELQQALTEGRIVIHPWIIAELALGALRDRARTLATLDFLPQVEVARVAELRFMIEARRLYSLGLGLTDAHLLASALISPATLLWTRDRRLREAAVILGVHANIS